MTKRRSAETNLVDQYRFHLCRLQLCPLQGRDFVFSFGRNYRCRPAYSSLLLMSKPGGGATEIERNQPVAGVPAHSSKLHQLPWEPSGRSASRRDQIPEPERRGGSVQQVLLALHRQCPDIPSGHFQISNERVQHGFHSASPDGPVTTMVAPHPDKIPGAAISTQRLAIRLPREPGVEDNILLHPIKRCQINMT
ncbi:hypothetical protein QN219_09860 [Sinorhizobium sp. 7-81]|uniref:hypothetical protein n=1 Tax=Sinorhizobium sp. 8-89 TaxID=3049089 RepID=UPI0024C319F9|nr:hypothetical protein [Sinorhizobium sp. 8-89]MDK1490364.1 hypothetical protein [Sinorhizobium sp. 8-89]